MRRYTLEKLWLIGQLLLLVILISYGAWFWTQFYTAPCDDFKDGLLSLTYAPARCLK